MPKNDLYDKTVKRLARGGIKDPTSQIVALAEEIERYREKIYGLEAVLSAGNDHQKEKTEFLGMTWFPRFTGWESVEKWIEERKRDGWKPYKWEYEPSTLTDHSCVVLVLARTKKIQ